MHPPPQVLHRSRQHGEGHTIVAGQRGTLTAVDEECERELEKEEEEEEEVGRIGWPNLWGYHAGSHKGERLIRDCGQYGATIHDSAP